jgi:hypothetical protein
LDGTVERLQFEVLAVGALFTLVQCFLGLHVSVDVGRKRSGE